MWYLLICSISLLSDFVNCIPVTSLPQKVLEDVGNKNHQVDNIEVHHDIDVDLKNQELANDLLPDQDNNEKEDKRLSHKEEQHLSDLALPVAVDGNAAQRYKTDSDEKKRNLAFIGQMKKLPLDKLVPVDHLDVVKMEQDGHMNKEYHKEMFLGEHEEFKAEAIENAEVKLKEVITKADIDRDGYLSKSEMEKWILEKMMEHFKEAKRENTIIFKHLDPDGDGFIKWKEYYVHFLLSRGFDPKNTWQHIVDYDDSIKLDQDDKDALVSYKFKWTDADKNPTDNQLSENEFMAFRHPEHSKQSLELMAYNVMKGVDTNYDGIIVEAEFAALPPGEVEGKEFEEMDRKWQEERRTEFREIMDVNHDKKVDLEELKNYLDPTNPVQAKLEAATLMSLMDDDKDNLLSVAEILKHSDIFISSKLVNFAANVHDEF
ncbi:unnamed protein product [Candidula unifasciata]|uniref:45 kDa calcium-binding protein n=1 Tax=Candidula unifasciata TaxID=100452 RepID=A0A8S3ZSW8_9EUPU|nr:unnamed protein product [Candidula unifasciata]